MHKFQNIIKAALLAPALLAAAPALAANTVTIQQVDASRPTQPVYFGLSNGNVAPGTDPYANYYGNSAQGFVNGSASNNNKATFTQRNNGTGSGMNWAATNRGRTEQNGSGNTATISQIGNAVGANAAFGGYVTGNVGDIKQTGNNNTAVQTVYGDVNTTGATQTGNGNAVTEKVSGKNNIVTLYQTGNNNATDGTVAYASPAGGNGNTVTLRQIGPGNNVKFSISPAGSTSGATANNNTLFIGQQNDGGAGNSLTTAQQGDKHYASVSEWGSANQVTLGQTGAKDTLGAYIHGNGNSVGIDQVNSTSINLGNYAAIQVTGSQNDLRNSVGSRIRQNGGNNWLAGDFSGNANIGQLVQDGTGNYIKASASGSNNQVYVYENGANNMATVSTSGTGNYANGGIINYNGLRNTLTIIQDGTNNYASASTVGNNNTVSISQPGNGNGNIAGGSVNGDNNKVTITQTGNYNHAAYGIGGPVYYAPAGGKSNNELTILQDGNYNWATVNQQGNNGKAEVSQTGNNSYPFAMIPGPNGVTSGELPVAAITQTGGDGNKAYITIGADRNAAYNSGARISQDGAGNYARAEVYAKDSFAGINQKGSGLSATVTIPAGVSNVIARVNQTYGQPIAVNAVTSVTVNH